MDKFIENQNKYGHLVSNLIDNLDLEEIDSNKKEKQEETQKDNSSSEENDSKMSQSEKEKEQSVDSDFSIAENEFKPTDENEDSKETVEKEVSSNQKFLNKNLDKKKYKIFTNIYDEVTNAEDLENENEILRIRKNFVHQLTNLQNVVAKLAN